MIDEQRGPAEAGHDFAWKPSFPLRHRGLRLLFMLAWFLLARWTPPMMHRWRVGLLNLFGARIHRTARVYASSVVWYPPNLEMAAHAVLGPGAICYCMAPISLGERAVISQRAHLCAGSHRLDDPAFSLTATPIRIEAKAWIAAEAFVGPGVTAGEGTVLGARGVAMRSLAPWTVHAGNPSRRIRMRPRF